MQSNYSIFHAIVLIPIITLASCSSGAGSSATSTDPANSTDALSNQSGIAVPIDRLSDSAIPDDIEADFVLELDYQDSSTNTLTENQIRTMPDASLDDVFEAFEAVSNTNPNMLATSNEFGLLMIDYLNENATVQLRSDALTQVQQLTWAERILLVANPSKIGPTRAAVGTAHTTTKSLFPGSQYKTRADAFRHAYWSWLLSDCCGDEWSTAFASAHEANTPRNDDFRMDMNNNARGRAIHNSRPGADSAAAIASILSSDLQYVNEKLANVSVTGRNLVYLEPKQSLVLFDDGPSFDDVFGISINGVAAANTPAGGSMTYEFITINSGEHTVDITCVEDVTEQGCGFKYSIVGAFTNGSGNKRAGQIIIQKGQSHVDTFTFPDMNSVKED